VTDPTLVVIAWAAMVEVLLKMKTYRLPLLSLRQQLDLHRQYHLRLPLRREARQLQLLGQMSARMFSTRIRSCRVAGLQNKYVSVFWKGINVLSH